MRTNISAIAMNEFSARVLNDKRVVGLMQKAAALLFNSGF